MVTLGDHLEQVRPRPLTSLCRCFSSLCLFLSLSIYLLRSFSAQLVHFVSTRTVNCMQIKVHALLYECQSCNTIFSTFVKNSKSVENRIVSGDVRFYWIRSLSVKALRKVKKVLIYQERSSSTSMTLHYCKTRLYVNLFY